MQKIVLDFENWTVPDYETFRLATVTGDKEISSNLLAKLIVEWDHPSLAPSDPLSYDELSLRDIGQIIRTVNQKGQELLTSTSVSDGFELDMLWNWKEFNQYTQATSKYDLDTMKTLLLKVVKAWPFKYSVKELEKQSFEDFCVLNAAIQKAVRESMQGE